MSQRSRYRRRRRHQACLKNIERLERACFPERFLDRRPTNFTQVYRKAEWLEA